MSVAINEKKCPSLGSKSAFRCSSDHGGTIEDEYYKTDNTWELLVHNDDETDSTIEKTNSSNINNTSFEKDVVFVSNEESDDYEVVSDDDECNTTVVNWRRSRQNSISSPDLRYLINNDGLTVVAEEGNILESTTNSKVTSAPSSNTSCWSVSSMGSKASFRDILVSQPNKVSSSCNQSTQQPILKGTKNRVIPKTRFVVVKPQSSTISRNFKSTGDLKALSTLPNNHDDDEDEEDNSYGCSSTEIYNNHKMMGAKGHSTGLKLRPDELKRKLWIQAKKNVQRQQK